MIKHSREVVFPPMFSITRDKTTGDNMCVGVCICICLRNCVSVFKYGSGLVCGCVVICYPVCVCVSRECVSVSILPKVMQQQQ